MTRQMTITEVKAKLLAVIDDVENGEEIEITRHGLTVARISPARGPHSSRGILAGIARTATDNLEDLYSTGVTWDVERNDPPS